MTDAARVFTLLAGVGLLLLLAAPGPCRADLVVNEDLGGISFGTVVLAGDTADGANNADWYLNTAVPDGNWGNEYVYRFELTSPALLGVTLYEADGDPDVFLLDSLATAPMGGKTAATGDLAFAEVDGDLPDTGAFGLFRAGTYYLSIDAFTDFDPPPAVPASTTFDLDLIALESTPPEDSVDLGRLAVEGEAFTIDTLGSDFDTILGVYDRDGFLLQEADDIDDITLQSELDFPSGLAAGEYYVALAGFETTFTDAFIVFPELDSEGGAYELNHPAGTTTGTLATGESQWFRFSVAVPEPSAGVLLLIAAGLAIHALRR